MIHSRDEIFGDGIGNISSVEIKPQLKLCSSNMLFQYYLFQREALAYIVFHV